MPRNVCEAVKPPRPQKREIAPLSPEQARRFLEACQGERLEALFVLAVHTGMRQGELLGLHWEDVDLEAGTLRVRTALAQTDDGPVLTSPKSAKSRRRSSSPAPPSKPSSATRPPRTPRGSSSGPSGRTMASSSPTAPAAS